jgi:hypothetical protein
MATFGTSTTGNSMFGTGTFGTTTSKPTFGQTATSTATQGAGMFGVPTTTTNAAGSFAFPQQQQTNAATTNPTGSFGFTGQQQQQQQQQQTNTAATNPTGSFGFTGQQQQQQQQQTNTAATNPTGSFGFTGQQQQQADGNTDKGHVAKTILDYVVVMKAQLDKLVPPSEPVVHTNISCKGCGKQHIIGVRYKCVVCTDYDLCEHCEAHGVHHEHVFVKIKDTKKFNALFPVFQK